ncbi:MAG: hypothetical protein CYG60_03845 [Actinobacteria bacterium]|nr:MAG: hypothetical protein CYG60_03845 [Actinomycetota bacterium]
MEVSMKIYGIANTRGMGLTIRLGEGLPDLLGLGHREEVVLPVFGVEAKLRAFVRAHPSLEADDSESFQTALLGDTYFDLAEKISAAVEAGEIETVVFDPVLSADGEWVSEAFEWPAEKFCDQMLTFRPVVMDIARRQEDIPEEQLPSSEAINKAYDWYMGRMLAYVYGPSRIYSELKQILGLKD